MRRTNASLMKEAGADVKVSADQRGHDVNTSINEYTGSSAAQKYLAADLLERFLEAPGCSISALSCTRHCRAIRRAGNRGVLGNLPFTQRRTVDP
jgi:hypothetical protein